MSSMFDEENGIPSVRRSSEYTQVKKTWGEEQWVVNNPLYCGKLLTIEAGRHTSMHFHSLKHETMLCIQGGFSIIFIGKNGDRAVRNLEPGDSVIIPPNTPHEIWGAHSALPNVLIEFSTQHFDSDSYRVGKPG